MIPSTVWCSLLVKVVRVKTGFSNKVSWWYRDFVGYFHAFMGLYFFLNQISLVGKVLKEIKLEIFHKKCQVFQRAVKLLGWPGRTLSRDIPETNFELLKQVITKRIELFETDRIFVQPCKQELFDFLDEYFSLKILGIYVLPQDTWLSSLTVVANPPLPRDKSKHPRIFVIHVAHVAIDLHMVMHIVS